MRAHRRERASSGACVDQAPPSKREPAQGGRRLRPVRRAVSSHSRRGRSSEPGSRPRGFQPSRGLEDFVPRPGHRAPARSGPGAVASPTLGPRAASKTGPSSSPRRQPPGRVHFEAMKPEKIDPEVARSSSRSTGALQTIYSLRVGDAESSRPAGCRQVTAQGGPAQRPLAGSRSFGAGGTVGEIPSGALRAWERVGGVRPDDAGLIIGTRRAAWSAATSAPVGHRGHLAVGEEPSGPRRTNPEEGQNRDAARVSRLASAPRHEFVRRAGSY